MENPFQPINGKLRLIEQRLNDLTLDIIPELKQTIKASSKSDDAQKFGNAKTAGKRYGVHPNTIRNWHKHGFVKIYIIEGVSLYSFPEIDAFLESKAKYRESS